MKPTIQTLRAITAVYMQGILRIVFIIAAIVFAIIYALVSFLSVEVSLWWLLLLIFVLPLTIIITGLSLILWFASKKILPRELTTTERETITVFTDKINELLEDARTPYPIALILIAKDVIRGRESVFLKRLIANSTTLKSDIAAIQKMFTS